MHRGGDSMTVTAIAVDDRTLSVSEVFGPTIQGEGRSQGRAVVFLRLGLCNLDCVWCDTPYTWDWTGKNGTVYDKTKELRTLTIREVEDELLVRTHLAGNPVVSRVVISGGEPLVQQRRLAPLVAVMAAHGVTCEIETNGTIMPNQDMVDLSLDGSVSFNCSPKLANSGIERDRRILPHVLEGIADLDSTFKYVVATDADVREVQTLHETVLAGVQPHRVYLMPEGTTAPTINSRLAWVHETAAARGWGVSPRLHVLTYGNKRGI